MKKTNITTKADLKKLAQERLRDAKNLFKCKRYDGAYYICGYAVEMILKYRICKVLGWEEYPTGENYKSFKTHDIEVLLHLAGAEKIKNKRFIAEWWAVMKWQPEIRYSLVKQTGADVKLMIEAAQTILKIL